MLRKVWSLWKRFGEFIGNIVARVILSVFYFTIFVPFAIGTRLFSDRLAIKSLPDHNWVARQLEPDSLEAVRRQA